VSSTSGRWSVPIGNLNWPRDIRGATILAFSVRQLLRVACLRLMVRPSSRMRDCALRSTAPCDSWLVDTLWSLPSCSWSECLTNSRRTQRAVRSGSNGWARRPCFTSAVLLAIDSCSWASSWHFRFRRRSAGRAPLDGQAPRIVPGLACPRTGVRGHGAVLRMAGSPPAAWLPRWPPRLGGCGG